MNDMGDPVTRNEMYEALKRQSEFLETVMKNGFEGLNQRMDVANGRTTKLEDRQNATDQVVAVLLDRAKQAEKKAEHAENVATNAKWWGSLAATLGVGVLEMVKNLFAN